MAANIEAWRLPTETHVASVSFGAPMNTPYSILIGFYHYNGEGVAKYIQMPKVCSISVPGMPQLVNWAQGRSKYIHIDIIVSIIQNGHREWRTVAVADGSTVAVTPKYAMTKYTSDCWDMVRLFVTKDEAQMAWDWAIERHGAGFDKMGMMCVTQTCFPRLCERDWEEYNRTHERDGLTEERYFCVSFLVRMLQHLGYWRHQNARLVTLDQAYDHLINAGYPED